MRTNVQVYNIDSVWAVTYNIKLFVIYVSHMKTSAHAIIMEIDYIPIHGGNTLM